MSGGKEQLDAALDGLLTSISNLEIGGCYAGWKAAEQAAAAERRNLHPHLLPRLRREKVGLPTLTGRIIIRSIPFLSLPCLASPAFPRSLGLLPNHWRLLRVRWLMLLLLLLLPPPWLVSRVEAVLLLLGFKKRYCGGNKLL
jgi:hypothetical protein